MNYTKYLPLTETTFYIMLSLTSPMHGYAIMQNVEILSENKVKIAAGTLYGAIENLIKQKLIGEVVSENKRRRVYALTPKGREVLKLELERLKYLIEIASKII
jgi:DNA-binding PadR family transcriptional regulator